MTTTENTAADVLSIKQGEAAPERVAVRLRWLRTHFGLKQREIAAMLGLGATQWNNWERGRDRLSLEGALKINQVFGISLDFLFLNRTDALSARLLTSWSDGDRESGSRS